MSCVPNMPTSNAHIECEGWWQQQYFGRQPMHNLRLRFDTGNMTGSGHDIIGLFTLRGTISTEGVVHLHKHYLGQHIVEYIGHYDGEGVLWGEWHIGDSSDSWMIKFIRKAVTSTEAAAIQEMR